MAVLTFPNITPDSLNFGIKYNTQISTTSLSGITQTVEMPGARWFGSMSFRDLTPAESTELKVFLLKLRGTAGRFSFGDLTNTTPADDTLSGALTISSGTVRTVNVDPTTGLFSVGDYIQIGNNSDESRELKMVIGVTGTTGNPQTLTVEPFIRRTDYVGKDVIYTNPTGIFLLDSDEQASWAVRSKAKLSDISLSFLEV